jgi:hypothetical protein
VRRFSFISFDRDVRSNEKIIRRQVERGSLVGLVNALKPDFEFANFTLEKLVEIAAQFDEERGFSGEALRKNDWTGIVSGGQFEETYAKIWARDVSTLKGEEWGRALARYALEHPKRRDNGVERPFVGEIRAALHAWNTNYDYHEKNLEISPDTFALVHREKDGLGRSTPQ